MFLNIPLLTIESRFLFIGLPLFSLKRLTIFGRGLFGGDGVRPVVLSFRRISPTSTGVLPFRVPFRLRPVRLFIGHVGPTFLQVGLIGSSISFESRFLTVKFRAGTWLLGFSEYIKPTRLN